MTNAGDQGVVSLRVRSERQSWRYPKGCCQQCGAAELSPRSKAGVICEPCRLRIAEQRRVLRASKPPEERDVREKAWRAAGFCWRCGGEVSPRSKSYCTPHLDLMVASNRKRRETGRVSEREKTRDVWRDMIRRCEDTWRPNYKEYGGRGIVVCDRWKTFDNFLADMGVRPSPDRSIERKDNDGNYEPSNCYWATKEEQMNNRQDSHKLTIDGETLTVAQWSRRTGVVPGTIHTRLKRGMSPEDAVSKKGTRMADAARDALKASK